MRANLLFRIYALLPIFAFANTLTLFAQLPLVLGDSITSFDGLKHVLTRRGESFEPFELNPTSWQPNRERPARFPADSTGWLYVKIQNAGSADRKLKLHFRHVMLTKARLYVVSNGQVDSSLSTGYDMPVRQRATRERDMSFFLMVPQGQTVEVYTAVFRRAIPNTVMLDIAEATTGDGTEWETLALATTIGFCLLMWLTALALVIYRRTKENCYYFMYVTGGTLYLIAAYGFGSLYLWPDAPGFQETAPVFFVTLGIAGFVLLARQVLETRRSAPIADRFLVFSMGMGLVLILAGWAMSLGLLPSGLYGPIALVVGITTVVMMTIIFVLAVLRALNRRQRAYWWFAGIFANMFILCLGALAIEAGLLPMEHLLTTVATIVAVPLELFLTQVFIATRMLGMLKARQLREIELLQEKESITSEKAEQQRLYANMLHEILKGEVQSALAEVREDGPLKNQLKELVQTCDLGQSFIHQGNDNLYTLMKDMEFVFSSRLNSETNERFFYCEIAPGLKEVYLGHRQRYELIFFLRECLNNIRKYSGYRYAGLKMHQNLTPAGKEAVTLEISDDGIGLQQALGIPDARIEIQQDNWKDFYAQYLRERRSTGIKGLFEKAERLQGTMRITSNQGTSVVVHLVFLPDSGYSPSE